MDLMLTSKKMSIAGRHDLSSVHVMTCTITQILMHVHPLGSATTDLATTNEIQSQRHLSIHIAHIIMHIFLYFCKYFFEEVL